METVDARPDPRRIVVVADDDEEMRTILASALRRRNYEVLLADSGDQVLARLRELADDGNAGVVDLVITDERMPGLSGLEVLQRLRAQGLGIPVILVSSFMDEGVRGTALRLGAAAVFAKPFNLLDLVAKVQDLLDG